MARNPHIVACMSKRYATRTPSSSRKKNLGSSITLAHHGSQQLSEHLARHAESSESVANGGSLSRGPAYSSSHGCVAQMAKASGHALKQHTFSPSRSPFASPWSPKERGVPRTASSTSPSKAIRPGSNEARFVPVVCINLDMHASSPEEAMCSSGIAPTGPETSLVAVPQQVALVEAMTADVFISQDNEAIANRFSSGQVQATGSSNSGVLPDKGISERDHTPRKSDPAPCGNVSSPCARSSLPSSRLQSSAKARVESEEQLRKGQLLERRQEKSQENPAHKPGEQLSKGQPLGRGQLPVKGQPLGRGHLPGRGQLPRPNVVSNGNAACRQECNAGFSKQSSAASSTQQVHTAKVNGISKGESCTTPRGKATPRAKSSSTTSPQNGKIPGGFSPPAYATTRAYTCRTANVTKMRSSSKEPWESRRRRDCSQETTPSRAKGSGAAQQKMAPKGERCSTPQQRYTTPRTRQPTCTSQLNSTPRRPCNTPRKSASAKKDNVTTSDLLRSPPLEHITLRDECPGTSESACEGLQRITLLENTKPLRDEYDSNESQRIDAKDEGGNIPLENMILRDEWSSTENRTLIEHVTLRDGCPITKSQSETTREESCTRLQEDVDLREQCSRMQTQSVSTKEDCCLQQSLAAREEPAANPKPPGLHPASKEASGRIQMNGSGKKRLEQHGNLAEGSNVTSSARDGRVSVAQSSLVEYSQMVPPPRGEQFSIAQGTMTSIGDWSAPLTRASPQGERYLSSQGSYAVTSQEELRSIQQEQRQDAALRLQRWFRKSYWRQVVMPKHLNKMLDLLHACMKIQRAWKARRQRKAVANMVKAPHSKAALQIAHAYWQGYKVRRVLEVRDLQLKVRLRHGLYLVILDTEEESFKGDQVRRGCRAGPRRDLHPWLEVLYAELRRLQLEVLDTFTAVLQGWKPLWGSAREQFLWQGWSHDLRRFPALSLARPRSDRSKAEIRECSKIDSDSEVSLLGSVHYQPCSPPQSPELGSWVARGHRSPSASTHTSMWSDDDMHDLPPTVSATGTPGVSPGMPCRAVTEHWSFKMLPRFTPSLRCSGPPETRACASSQWEEEPEPGPDCE